MRASFCSCCCLRRACACLGPSCLRLGVGSLLRRLRLRLLGGLCLRLLVQGIGELSAAVEASVNPFQLGDDAQGLSVVVETTSIGGC